MEKNIRNIEYLRSIILDLPGNYARTKEGIAEAIRVGVANGVGDDVISGKVAEVFGQLRNEKWRRKDVYFLVHDLLSSHRDMYEDFDILLLEIDSSLIGFVSAEGLDAYHDEVNMSRDRLERYVRNYEWI